MTSSAVGVSGLSRADTCTGPAKLLRVNDDLPAAVQKVITLQAPKNQRHIQDHAPFLEGPSPPFGRVQTPFWKRVQVLLGDPGPGLECSVVLNVDLFYF